MKNISIKQGQSDCLYQKIDTDVDVEITVEESGFIEYYFVLCGGSDVRVTVSLIGAHAEAKVIGLVPGVGKKVNIQTLQHHMAHHTTSNLLVKSLVDTGQHFSYKGYIVVDPVAQKTDAYQRNENILLSADAHAETAPGLEIEANDVRCTHGATVGQIDPEQLWYLGTRGVSPADAKKLIATGFLESAITSSNDTMFKNIKEDIWRPIQKLQF